MKFRKLIRIIDKEPVFPTGFLLAGEENRADISKQLTRWTSSGKIYQLRRGVYSLAPPYQKVAPHPFLVANRLMPGSYISLQSALAYYGLIPEIVPVTTSVTTRRQNRWENPLGVYVFRYLQESYMFGYQHIEVAPDQMAFVAEAEKALLDLIYLTPGADSKEYLIELRLQNTERLDLEKLTRFAERMDKPKLLRVVSSLEAVIKEEESYHTL
jgi:predicted transcriptional regulator of viral defense system